MRQSKLFTKTKKEAPADEVAKNAQLLTLHRTTMTLKSKLKI